MKKLVKKLVKKVAAKKAAKKKPVAKKKASAKRRAPVVSNASKIVASLAHTGRRYVKAQIRMGRGGSVIFQVLDAKGKVREFQGTNPGWENLGEILNQVEFRLSSLNGGKEKFAPVQVAAYSPSVIHVQVPFAPKNINRAYGAAFNVESPALVTAVTEILNAA